MRRSAVAGIVLGLAFVLSAPWAGADTVVLTDGTRLTGTVEASGKGLVVTTGSGTLTVPRWRVAALEDGDFALFDEWMWDHAEEL